MALPSLADLESVKSKLKATKTVIRPHPCIAAGVEQHGRDFLGDAEASKERHEDEEATADAARAAASILKAASFVVVHTGAGIATAAGVGDFRGANGVWTQLSKGIIPDDSYDITECVPSFAHMAIKAFVDAGIVKQVISTNHDGLHLKSGLVVGENLHELHGNVYVERCVLCHKDYARPYPILRTADRYTGRNCECGSQLWDSGIDFGQTLPEHQLRNAQDAAVLADVHVVLGSSLQVAPASLLPRQYGGKLILVTKSETPVDKSPAGNLAVRSYGDINKFMGVLAGRLNVNVPRAPTLEEAGVVSITMLLKRRWALREERVAAIKAGEQNIVDNSLPYGWSHHVDKESKGIDYWFHNPSNRISFGRPCEEDEAGRTACVDPREARAKAAEQAYSAAAPTISEARAKLTARFGRGKGDVPRLPPRQRIQIPSKGKGVKGELATASSTSNMGETKNETTSVSSESKKSDTQPSPRLRWGIGPGLQDSEAQVPSERTMQSAQMETYTATLPLNQSGVAKGERKGKPPPPPQIRGKGDRAPTANETIGHLVQTRVVHSAIVNKLS